MNKKHFLSELSSNSSAIRTKSTFLVKPCYEGRPFPCYQSGFRDTTSESVRVNRLEDMRLKIAECLECSVECKDNTKRSTLNSQLYHEFYDLKGKQPVFFLMETLSPEGSYLWNGRILFSHVNKETSRRLVEQHRKEWNVVLSFSDPDADRYFFVVDTNADVLTEEAFLKSRKEWADRLNRTMSHVTQHNMSFYVRALTPDYYDIVDLDALFGKPEPAHRQDDFRLCRPVSIGEVIRSIFGNVFTSKC